VIGIGDRDDLAGLNVNGIGDLWLLGETVLLLLLLLLLLELSSESLLRLDEL
jgi:hypothetical protein